MKYAYLQGGPLNGRKWKVYLLKEIITIKSNPKYKPLNYRRTSGITQYFIKKRRTEYAYYQFIKGVENGTGK